MKKNDFSKTLWNEGFLSRLMLFSSMLFFVVLAACGGGSSGGSSPTASSVTGVYGGGTTTATYYFPRLVDTVYAISNYSPGSFTLSLNANNQFSLDDNQGNLGGGTFTISGSTLTLNGTLYINPTVCTSNTTSCTYSIKSSLSIGSSGAVSGTINIYNTATGSLVYSSPIDVTPITLPSVSLVKLEGASFTSTYTTTQTSPTNYDCASNAVFSGTISVSVNASTFYVPCTTFDSYPAGSMSGGLFTPSANANETITFCSTTGTNCIPTTLNGLTARPEPYGTFSVPSGALGFYLTTTFTTDSPTPCNTIPCSMGVYGYIQPFSGSGGGPVGEVVVSATYSGGLIEVCNGLANIVVSSSGTVTGTYLDIDGCVPTTGYATYTSGGSRYYNFPVSVTMFSTTQY